MTSTINSAERRKTIESSKMAEIKKIYMKMNVDHMKTFLLPNYGKKVNLKTIS